MTMQARVRFTPSRFGVLAPPGTTLASSARARFIQDLYAALNLSGNDAVRLWLPKVTDTTTSTTEDPNAATVTHDATIAARIANLGSGVTVSFNGTTQWSTMPDADDLSFGDAAVDRPFSIMFLGNITDTAAQRVIVAKFETTANRREYQLSIDASDKVSWFLAGNGAGSQLIRLVTTNSATMGSNALVTATYDGTGSSAGMRVYQSVSNLAGTRTDTSYTAMVPEAATVSIGANQTAAGTGANFYSGTMAFVLIVAKQVQPAEIFAAKAAINAFYGLAL